MPIMSDFYLKKYLSAMPIMSFDSSKYNNLKTYRIEAREEIKKFCEEHLVDFTDFGTFSVEIENKGFSVKIEINDSKRFRLWNDIKDDMLTFLSYNEYKLFDIHFILVSWVYNEKLKSLVADISPTAIKKRKISFVDEVLKDEFFINEEIIEIYLNFRY